MTCRSESSAWFRLSSPRTNPPRSHPFAQESGRRSAGLPAEGIRCLLWWNDLMADFNLQP
ncbi:hypothetical protein RHMOL_Rhmol06G0214400 [Rhododendron molle]|uniref:Uncharacterized protein n=1 Tax=Rhododendron molle TaxID=49168 RepID=A0ACC0NFC6_RHOML|nr:hypothetical protein RHMOL_Rhmol06G0214400 [Rhododendron molle]